MITVQLRGGLGNQLFQYAAARSLALHHGTSVAFDLRLLNSAKPYAVSRAYELNAFNIKPSQPPLLGRMAFGMVDIPYKNIVKSYLYSWLRATKYAEQSLSFDPAMCDATSARTYLMGYFQSKRYFEDIEEQLRAELKFVDKPKIQLREIAGSATLASLHVRRGDYVDNPVTNRFHGLCSVEYYEKAIAYLTDKLGDIHLFVFSDDQAWVRKHLYLAHSATFVEVHPDEPCYKDMQLMSQCQHHIIANSSFSWWGAWLNASPDKIVVAPQRWYADDIAQEQAQDIVPASWIKM